MAGIAHYLVCGGDGFLTAWTSVFDELVIVSDRGQFGHLPIWKTPTRSQRKLLLGNLWNA